MAYRKIMLRAKNLTKAKQFSKMHRKLSTFYYSPERVSSVKRNFKAGLAGGVPGWDVTLVRRKVERFKRGKRKGQLRPKFNKGCR